MAKRAASVALKDVNPVTLKRRRLEEEVKKIRFKPRGQDNCKWVEREEEALERSLAALKEYKKSLKDHWPPLDDVEAIKFRLTKPKRGETKTFGAVPTYLREDGTRTMGYTTRFDATTSEEDEDHPGYKDMGVVYYPEETFERVLERLREFLRPSFSKRVAVYFY
jgi:hypothetical protein